MGIDPVSLAVVGLAGAGISAAGQYESGQASQEAYAYQSQVAANNAVLAKEQAKYDIQAGEVAATNSELKTRATVGSERASQGASGIDTTTGSAAAVRAGTEEMGMLDALTIRSNAAKKAWSDEVAATSDTAQSRLDTMAGAQASEAGSIGAAGSLLSGVSTVGSNWLKFQNSYGTTPGAGV